MNHPFKPSGLGHIGFLMHPEAQQLRIQAAGRTADGLALFTIPESRVCTTGIRVTKYGRHVATLRHLAVDRSHIAYAYSPDQGGYRDLPLGPCYLAMDA